MNRKIVSLTVALAFLLALLAACGGGDEPAVVLTIPPAATDDPIAASVNQTVAAIAVAETVAALTGNNTATEAPAPTATPEEATAVAESPTNEPPTDEPDTPEPPDVVNDAPAVATEPPTAEAAASCTTITGVNARRGPGTVYDPPLGALAANTELLPISYVNPGFPSGEWLEAQVISSGQVVWVTAGSQFVRCTIAPSSLPRPATILATPRPTATPTPLPPTATPTRVVAGLPPDVQNDIPGGACERTDHIKTRIEMNPNFLYRVYARDDRAGPNDGDGMDFVRFTISDSFGTLYQREERVAGYCIFQGGEPNCRPWPFNEQGQFTWGNGGPAVQPGTYQVFIEVVSKEPDPSNNSTTCNWNFDMTVTLP